MGWFNISLKVSEQSFSQRRGFRSNFMKWEDVVCVHGEKVDKIAFDENFMILSDRRGTSIALGEMDQGFSSFERILHRKLSDFPTGWREWVESTEPSTRTHIWGAHIP